MKRFDSPECVEAAAKAMYDRVMGLGSWENLLHTEPIKYLHRADAKAAITAMLEQMRMTEDQAWAKAAYETTPDKELQDVASAAYVKCLRNLGLITEEKP